LVPVLQSHFALATHKEQLQVHEADAAKFLLPAGKSPLVVCGNLPYHLTSTLVLKTCVEAAELCGAVFLVQKEVAERITASPGNKDYSTLAVWVQCLFDAFISRTLPPGCFVPPPKVDSAVVVMRTKTPAPLAPHLFPKLKTLVKQAFGQRRKTLRNNFKKHPAVLAHLEALGVSLSQRPEEISVETYLALVKRMENPV